MDKNTMKAALLGAGTVGSGVYALSDMLADEMMEKTGSGLIIKKVLVQNLYKNRAGIPKEIITSDWNEILNDDEIKIIIEVMGGVEPARTYITQAILVGKQVVTANKDLLAECGQELLGLAEAHGVDLQFEAAVAGVLGKHGVVIQQAVSKAAKDGVQELVIITGNVREMDFDQAFEVLRILPEILELCSRIRVYG